MVTGAAVGLSVLLIAVVGYYDSKVRMNTAPITTTHRHKHTPTQIHTRASLAVHFVFRRSG